MPMPCPVLCSGTVYKVLLYGTTPCAAKIVELGHGNEQLFIQVRVLGADPGC